MKAFLDRVLDSAERVVGPQTIPAAAPAPIEEFEDNPAIPDAREFEAQPAEVPTPFPKKPALSVEERPAEPAVSMTPERKIGSEPEAATDETIERPQPPFANSETKSDRRFEERQVVRETVSLVDGSGDPLTPPWSKKPERAATRPSWSGAWVDAPPASSAPSNPQVIVRNIESDSRSMDLRYVLDSAEVVQETAPTTVSVVSEKKSSSEPAEAAPPAPIAAPPAIAPPNTGTPASLQRTESEPSTSGLIIQNLEVKVVTRAPEPPARHAARPTEPVRQTPAAGAWVSSARRYAGRV